MVFHPLRAFTVFATIAVYPQSRGTEKQEIEMFEYIEETEAIDMAVSAAARYVLTSRFGGQARLADHPEIGKDDRINDAVFYAEEAGFILAAVNSMDRELAREVVEKGVAEHFAAHPINTVFTRNPLGIKGKKNVAQNLISADGKAV
jgi:plasmid stabilization system protein ParE